MATSTQPTTPPRQRVPAAERRDELIEAAVHEFAHGGLHGTPVDRIARRVGVAQPYVFSLFGSKRDLFLAAVTRGFDRVGELFAQTAAEVKASGAPDEPDASGAPVATDASGAPVATEASGAPVATEASGTPAEDAVLQAMGLAYVEMLGSDRDCLMLQHHAYAACDDETIREHVRGCFARLVAEVQRLSGADQERIDEFMRYGMWLNVAAAMGVPDLSVGCEWMLAEQHRDTQPIP